MIRYQPGSAPIMSQHEAVMSAFTISLYFNELVHLKVINWGINSTVCQPQLLIFLTVLPHFNIRIQSY